MSIAVSRVGRERRQRGWLGTLRRGLYGLMLWYSQHAMAQPEDRPKFSPMPAKVSVAIESVTPADRGGPAHYRVEINRDDPRLTPELSRVSAWLRRQSWDFDEDDLRTVRQLRGGMRVDVPLDDVSQFYLNFIPGNRERREGLRWQPRADEPLPDQRTPLWSVGCLMHTRGREAGREMSDGEKAELGFTPQLSINLDGRHETATGTRQLTLQHGDWVDPASGEVEAAGAWQLHLRWKF